MQLVYQVSTSSVQDLLFGTVEQDIF